MMTQLNGSVLSTFPYKTFSWVEDLIYFEGTLLAHYTGQNDQDYLLHWVDNDESLNRWLIYKVTKQRLLNYLRGQEDLRDILMYTSSDLILVADINENGEYQHMQLATLSELPANYLPVEYTYYTLPIPSHYADWSNRSIAESENIGQTRNDLLKGRAFYANLKPSSTKHGTAPEVSQMKDYLYNIDNSWNSYTAVNYEKRFAHNYNDEKQKRAQLRLIRQETILRGVDFGPGSFGVALAPDISNSSDKLSQDVINWLKTLPQQFQTEVLDKDFDNPESIQELSASYNAEQLESFLAPFLKIAENRTYQIARADHDFKPIAKPIKVDKSVRVEIERKVRDNIDIVPVVPEKELVTIVVEKEKGQDIKNMSAKQITSKIVSSKPVENYTIELDSISWNGIVYKLIHPIELEATFNNQRYKVVEPQTRKDGEGQTSDEALGKLQERMVRVYSRLNNMIPEFMTEAEVDEKKLFDSLILHE